MWSGELSDKYAAVIYVWNKELHINVKVKFLKIGPLFVGMTRLATGVSEGKERS